MSVLHEDYPQERLRGILRSQEKFRPVPQANEREYWDALPEAVKSEWVTRGQARFDYGWPPLLASRYMDFVKNGNRSRFEEVYFDRRIALAELVLAECVEGQGRFMEQIVNGVWLICEESNWVVPAHMSISLLSRGFALPDVDDAVIDLFSAETASLLSWTLYLLSPALDEACPMLGRRIGRELERRMLNPFLERDDFWWMGFQDRKVNNWNPWILSNVIASFLLMESDEVRRASAIHKALRSLEAFLAVYHPDGGCDEGPGYWGHAGASLFDCLDLLYTATDGQMNFFRLPLVQAIGRYIAKVHIDGDWFVNFADGDARLRIYGDVVYRYGKRIEDPGMQSLGAYAFQRRGWKEQKFAPLLRIVPSLSLYTELTTHKEVPAYPRDVWMDGIEVFAAREREGSAQGLYLAAKGGHNDESHNHNDVGHFIVYADGKPMLIDVGVENYTSKTFSPRRYEIWTMQSAFHSLPTVGGIQQAAGKAYRARDVHYAADDSFAELRMELAGAYPEEAGIEQWIRTFRLNRGEGSPAEVSVSDRFMLKHPVSELMLSLISLHAPSAAEGKLLVRDPSSGTGVELDYDEDQLSAVVEEIPLTDSRVRSVWGDQLYRIVLKANNAVQQGEWKLRIRQL